MSVKIKYVDELDHLITEEQKSGLTSYSKITYINDAIKIRETFSKTRRSNYITISYFLDAMEDKNIILQHYTDKSINSKCDLYFNKQSANNCHLWDWESYDTDGLICFRGKMVFNNAHKMLFVCTFDLITGQLNKGAWKSYFGNKFENEFDDLLVRVHYDSAGAVESVVDVHGGFGHEESLTLGEFLADANFSKIHFPWNQYPYYHSVLPYLPSGIL